MAKTKGERPSSESLWCKNCNRRLAARYETVRRQFECGADTWSEWWYTGRISGYGFASTFCNKSCAVRFGVRCAQAGTELGSFDPGRVIPGSKGGRTDHVQGQG